MSSPRIGSPSSIDAAATRSGSLKCVVASTIARARRSGSSDLKMPEPDEVALGAELHDERRVRGRRDPARAEERHGEPPGLGDLAHDLHRSTDLLGLRAELLAAERAKALDAAHDPAEVADGFDDVSGARLALRADHRGALADPAKRLAQIGRAADERDLEGVLVDVMRLIGGRQHLGLVDVVDLERLEDLCLGEVADAGLGHDRDGHGLLDLLDHARAGHPRDPAVGPDVRRAPARAPSPPPRRRPRRSAPARRWSRP